VSQNSFIFCFILVQWRSYTITYYRIYCSYVSSDKRYNTRIQNQLQNASLFLEKYIFLSVKSTAFRVIDDRMPLASRDGELNIYKRLVKGSSQMHFTGFKPIYKAMRTSPPLGSLYSPSSGLSVLD